MRQKLFALLREHGTNETVIKEVVERSLELNHLYEDMGFSSREELGRFMSLHFPTLALKKPPEIRWKRYLFDLINEMPPACRGCYEIDICRVGGGC